MASQSLRGPAAPRPAIDRTVAARVFHILDTDRDEFVRLSDLQEFVARRRLEELLPDSVVRAMFAEVDHDSDGVVTMREFCTALGGQLPRTRMGALWLELAARALPGEPLVVAPMPPPAPQRVLAQFERIERRADEGAFRPDLSLTRSYGSRPSVRRRRSSGGSGAAASARADSTGRSSIDPGAPAPPPPPPPAAARSPAGPAPDFERTINRAIASRSSSPGPPSAGAYPPSPGAWAALGLPPADDAGSAFPPPPSFSAAAAAGHPLSELLPQPRYPADGATTPATEAAGMGGAGLATWPPAACPTFAFASRRLFDAALRSSHDASSDRELARAYGLLSLSDPGPRPPPAAPPLPLEDAPLPKRPSTSPPPSGRALALLLPASPGSPRKEPPSSTRGAAALGLAGTRALLAPVAPAASTPRADGGPAFRLAFRPEHHLDFKSLQARAAAAARGGPATGYATPRVPTFRELGRLPLSTDFSSTTLKGRPPAPVEYVPPGADVRALAPVAGHASNPNNASRPFVTRFGRLPRHINLDGASVAGQAGPPDPAHAPARPAFWSLPAAAPASQFSVYVRGSKPRDPADFKRDAEEKRALAAAAARRPNSRGA